jgi:hypothetical protein
LEESGDSAVRQDAGAARPVSQEFFQDDALGRGQFSRQLDDVDKLGIDGAGGETGSGEILEELLDAKLGKGRRAAKDQHGRGGRTLANIAGAVKEAQHGNKGEGGQG